VFDVAGDAYDSFMGRWSRMLAPRLADFAGIRSGQRVLDVGSGTGMLTAELVARVGSANVVAVEPSASFAAIMRRRFPNIEFHRAPAERLPLADATFDAALAQLVVHFMDDPTAGLREMARVTRPGGIVATCVWDFAGGRDALADFWAPARMLFAGTDDESGLAGTRDGHLRELMSAAGLHDVDQATLTVQLSVATFDEWWAPFERGVGPAGVYLATRSPEEREALRRACLARLGAGPLTFTGTAWAARGHP
jgi:SAM-dependent methyltransferase